MKRENRDVLYIVIPAYNEEETIRKVIGDWYPVVERHDGEGRSRLVVIDDGSRDRTCEIMLEEAEKRPLLVPVTKENSGHGATVLHGYRYALRHGADFIFQTDSDGQTLPAEFERFWNLRNDYDCVMGWRKRRQDGFSRVCVSAVLRLVIRLFFRVRVTDPNVPYRLMKASVLEKYLDLVPEDYFLSNVLISVIFTVYRRKMKSIPITFRPRQGGVNSINIPRILRIGLRAFCEFPRLNRRIRERL